MAGMKSFNARAVLLARRQAARTAPVVAAARASGKVPTYKGRRTPDANYSLGHSMGYKDVSNAVAGPRHTRHAIHARIRKLNSGNAVAAPFWKGYASGVRRSGEDWMNHLYTATGGRKTRAYRRVSGLMNKV